MKYIIGILVLSALSLHALCTLDEGKGLYKDKAFSKALSCLQKLEVETKDYVELDLLIAQSAHALGQVNVAINAYERVLIEDPHNAQAQRGLMPLYKDNTLSEASYVEMSSLLRGRLSVEQRATLAQLKKEETQSRQEKFLANISINLGYDSNVNASPGEGTLNQYILDIGAVNTTGTNEISSSFINTQIDLVYWNALESIDNWYVRGDLNFIYQDNFSAHYFDLTYTKLSVGMGYSQGNINIYLPIVYDRLYYLERDLAESYGFEPSILLQFDEGYYGSLNLEYSTRNYLNSSDTVKDYDLYGVSVSLHKVISNHYYFLRTEYEYLSAKEEIIKYINKDIYSLSVGGSYALSEDLYIDAEYRFRYLKYKDTLVTSSSKREDKYNKLEAVLRYQFSKLMYLGYETKYIKNNSNYVPVHYEKYINQMIFDYRF